MGSCLSIVPSRQKTYEEILGKAWVSRNCVLDSALQVKLMRVVTDAYQGSAACLLQGAYNRLRLQERTNSKLKDVESDLKHQQLKDQFEKLQNNLTTLAEFLNLP